jgi:uncharacterized repeat protein (TIGR03837 family)
VRVLPFVPQTDYDRLLWACDLNFVRGEDSVVRAQWAGRPFVWHIYPQDENLHHIKLRAFLKRYAVDCAGLSDFSLSWNGAAPEMVAERGWNLLWRELYAAMPALRVRAGQWQREMLKNGDMSGNLLRFAAKLRSAAQENEV